MATTRGETSIERGCLSRALGLDREQAWAVWRAARRVVRADGSPTMPRSAALLEASAEALGVDIDGETGASLQDDDLDLEAVFPSGIARRCVVDGLVIAACIEGEISIERERAVLQIAESARVRSHWAELLPALRRGRVFAIKRALMVRAPDARRLFRRTWDEEGALGMVRAAAFVLGLDRDRELAARFRDLAALPEGCFGRAVAEHFRTRGLSFPGEPRAIPERMLHHDLMHVLTGYDTDPAGECELAAFYAGFAQGDAFTFLVIALATFHLNLAVSPAVVQPSRGAFDPVRAIAAFVRGRGLSVDVMGTWDYWRLMPLPMAAVQASLGIARGGSAWGA